MELQQLSTHQLERLITETTIMDIEFCMGSIPPMHVLARSAEQIQNGKPEQWALPLMMVSQGRVVGFCGFKREPKGGDIEIGYNVSPEQQGRGFAKSAVKQICQIAFSSSSVEGVIALISSTNLASLNVVKANGFVFQGLTFDEEGEELEKWVMNKNSSKSSKRN